MKSRYGFWMISICWIGLAGCANWQNRVNNTNGPGTAATLNATTVTGAPLGSAPGAAFGEPPPPVAPAPSDPSMSLAPLGAQQPQRLDLSAIEQTTNPSPEKMYNLESPSRTAASAKVSGSSSKKSSTISRLASKASKPETSKTPAAIDSTPRVSTIERLSAGASTTKEPATPVEVPQNAKSEAVAPAQSDAPLLDTALLAQPVRKGASKDNKPASNSTGPQSSVLPNNKILDGNTKPVIYPVSNPVADEPVDTTHYS